MLSIGAQMCTVSFCASFYGTHLRATGVGWAMGIGRVGAICGPVLGGLLLDAGMGTAALFSTTAVASLGAAAAMWLMKFSSPH
jgi:AAHS family 4-hydroxybenzoate transporter-like MFS transporter